MIYGVGVGAHAGTAGPRKELFPQRLVIITQSSSKRTTPHSNNFPKAPSPLHRSISLIFTDSQGGQRQVPFNIYCVAQEAHTGKTGLH